MDCRDEPGNDGLRKTLGSRETATRDCVSAVGTAPRTTAALGPPQDENLSDVMNKGERFAALPLSADNGLTVYIPWAFSHTSWVQAPSGSLVMTGVEGLASSVSTVRW